ncbi:MAG: ribonuclease III [Lachnospiraceae bacterium]|nr:ribonuclease III [Lachnospiraceae bacterium]MDD3617045.1 ribonuclease III [Lachnospiraceae bacterium]
MQEHNVENIQSVIGYQFKKKELLICAMTHTSYANEHRRENVKHNERLEFLGDAVLEVVSSEYLFRKYDQWDEGSMTRKRASMVCEPTLAMCGREFHIDQYILLGKGEELTGGRKRDSIVSDAVEALIGAIYLDGGFASAKEFIQNHILNGIEEKQLFFDSKTILQEIVQGEDMGDISYELEKEEGPDHDKSFHVNALIGPEVYGHGVGHTKKAAEQQAAYSAIQKLQKR